jgi:HAD superfamily hydrolase (TIGR01484 family)
MKYKALIFDIDGTAVPNREDGVPSPRLIKAVLDAKEYVTFSAATGRPWYLAKSIIKTLNIESPCVISGGAQIVNPIDEKILWEKSLDRDQVREIVNILLPFDYEVYFSDDDSPSNLKEKVLDTTERIIWVAGLTEEQALELEKKIMAVGHISTHIVPDWTAERYVLNISHKEATKKHALEVLLEMIQVDRSLVIAVGDSGNDLPLFAVSGYKVAMGNATSGLKEIADYTTDTADEDGLAKVIEKLVLESDPS